MDYFSLTYIVPLQKRQLKTFPHKIKQEIVNKVEFRCKLFLGVEKKHKKQLMYF